MIFEKWANEVKESELFREADKPMLRAAYSSDPLGAMTVLNNMFARLGIESYDKKNHFFKWLLDNMALSASRIEEGEIRWLWEPIIARGSITFLDGMPGSGKTYIACSIAAMLSKGKSPVTCEGSTLFCSGDDSPRDTLIPRLNILQADLSKINFLPLDDSITIDDIERFVGILCQTQDTRLIIFDTISDYLPSMRNSTKTNEALRALTTLATEFDIAMLCLRHLTKNSDGKHMPVGSYALNGKARSILFVNDNRIKHIKSNLAQKSKPIEFDIWDDGLVWLDGSALQRMCRQQMKEDALDRQRSSDLAYRIL